jgi:hypothetical protein
VRVRRILGDEKSVWFDDPRRQYAEAEGAPLSRISAVVSAFTAMAIGCRPPRELGNRITTRVTADLLCDFHLHLTTARATLFAVYSEYLRASKNGFVNLRVGDRQLALRWI